MRLNTRALLKWTRMPSKIKENLVLASTRVHPLMSIAKERTVSGFATWKESPSIEVGQEKTFEDVLPIFTYRDYKPKPFIVYTRHEVETNDLIGCLRSGFGLTFLLV